MEKYNHLIPKLLKVSAIVLFKKIYYAMPKEKVSDRLRRHEEEHVRQQEKEGAIRFKLKYFAEYIKNLIKYRNHNQAYLNISYESEARKAEVKAWSLETGYR